MHCEFLSSSFRYSGSILLRILACGRNVKNLSELSSLGHFLKGSSAALGITKVQNTCEEIQHYGKKEDVKASHELTEADALERIQVCVKRGKGEYKVARAWLEAWFKKAKSPSE